MAVNQQRRTALKRLMADLDELSRFPVAGISAAPLEDDMFEWHCNILLFDVPQHLIMFFPEEYPYKPPSAELAGDFTYSAGANQHGKKGIQICLPMFSDYINYHREWEKEAGVGWCPGYTVQTCLLNVLSFLAELKNTQSNNVKNAETYSCPDCGHTFETPFPRMRKEESIRALPVIRHHIPNLQPTPDKSAGESLTENTRDLFEGRTNTKLSRTTSEIQGMTSKSKLRKCRSDTHLRRTSTVTKATSTNELLGKLTDLSERFQITDYISKDKFNPQVTPISNRDIFGYGLEITDTGLDIFVRSPYEFLTADSFLSMMESSGYVQSMMKRELSHFLPLFLCSNHASGIKDIFEQTVKEISMLIFLDESPDITINEHILNMIPALMFDSQLLASDSCILGYFAIHRLFLWAVDTYPGLQEMVDTRLQAFIEKPECRIVKACPEIGILLMLLTVSTKYRWHDIAESYMTEFWRRRTIDVVLSECDDTLGLLTTSMSMRLTRTGQHTMESRKQLAYQVRFMDVAMPRGLTRAEVITRYDDNLGFPTDVMVAEMKEIFRKVTLVDRENYADWFDLLKLESPSDDELFQTLNDALQFCLDTRDYNLSCPNYEKNGWHRANKAYQKALKSAAMLKLVAEEGNNNVNVELADGLDVEVRRSARLLAKRKLNVLQNNEIGSNKKVKR